MKEIIDNKDNLNINNINNFVTRVKALIINSNDEVLFAHQWNKYQFVGGRIEENENLNDALKREIKEETGLDLNDNYEPIVKRTSYYKNHPEDGINSKVDIYYYEIKADKKYDLNNIELTEDEINGNFRLEYIKYSDIDKIISDNAIKYEEAVHLTNELKDFFKEYEDYKNERL